MVAALLLSWGLLAAGDHLAYEAAKAQAGRDPEAHIKLALWCEQHGLTAERAKHLALAVLCDPKNAVARGLMGFVQYQGSWRRPEAVAAKIKANAERAAKFAEYADRRVKAPHTADGQWKLALWCEEQGLNAEATAHLWATIRLDPRREAAWKHLGYKKQGGRWTNDAQLAAEKEEHRLQEKADRRWKPLLEKWSGWLNEKGAHRQEAEDDLAHVTDPRAVPMVWAVFARGSEARQRVAVRTLGQIDSPAATRDLALLALFSRSAEVRRTAAETLDRRDLRDFAGLLIGFLGEPIKYQVRPVNGPGSQGELFIEGKQADLKRMYSPPAAPSVPVQPNDVVGYDSNGLPFVAHPFTAVMDTPVGSSGVMPMQSNAAAVTQQLADLLTQHGMSAAQSHQLTQSLAANAAPMVIAGGGNPKAGVIGIETISPGVTEIPIGAMILQAQAAAFAAQARLVNDVQTIERYNAPIQQLNERVTAVLRQTSHQDFGTDRKAWQKWFVDLLGYAAQPQMASPEKPLLVEDVALDAQPQITPTTVVGAPSIVVQIHHSCFGRGTLVRALTGMEPIESIAPGDQVLTQDGRTGALSYQPVLRALHNPPNTTLAIKLEAETVIVTGIHRFWKAGQGWVMARDLKTGDIIRTLGGMATVTTIEDAPVQPVFNLEVASGQSFFVGKQGALVHDNSLVQPVPEPFDAAPEITAATSP